MLWLEPYILFNGFPTNDYDSTPLIYNVIPVVVGVASEDILEYSVMFAKESIQDIFSTKVIYDVFNSIEDDWHDVYVPEQLALPSTVIPVGKADSNLNERSIFTFPTLSIRKIGCVAPFCVFVAFPN